MNSLVMLHSIQSHISTSPTDGFAQHTHTHTPGVSSNECLAHSIPPSTLTHARKLSDFLGCRLNDPSFVGAMGLYDCTPDVWLNCAVSYTAEAHYHN